MDSRVSQQQNTGIKVSIDSSRVRQTPKTDFGSVMATGMERTGSAVMEAGRIAAPFIPGGAVLSGAITGVASLKASAAGQGAPLTAGANGTPLVGSSGSTGSYSGAGASGTADQVSTLAASGDPNAVMMAETRRMQELNMSFNLQYLQLQEKMQAENRQFTVLSNVIKTKHDTAKSAIGNIR
ncbi:MAG: hypothetical protein AAB426_00910 [Myxococcota bacterium]